MLLVNYAIKGHSFAPRIYVHQISIPFISSLVFFRLQIVYQTHSCKWPLSSFPLLVQFHSRGDGTTSYVLPHMGFIGVCSTKFMSRFGHTLGVDFDRQFWSEIG